MDVSEAGNTFVPEWVRVDVIFAIIHAFSMWVRLAKTVGPECRRFSYE